MVSMTHFGELSIKRLRKPRSIQVLVGATLFRFESCRAHHFIINGLLSRYSVRLTPLTTP
jgi:hypothetical protein